MLSGKQTQRESIMKKIPLVEERLSESGAMFKDRAGRRWFELAKALIS